MTPPQGGTPYVRSDYRSHGTKLLHDTATTVLAVKSKVDSDLVEDLVLAISTASETTISAQKGNLSRIGFEIISVNASDRTKGIASIEKGNLERLASRITVYADSQDNRGKTYFAPIESIDEVDPLTKIDEILLQKGERSCIIFLYPNLSPDDQNKVLQEISFSIAGETEQVSKFLKTSTSGYAITAVLDAERIINLATVYNSVRSIKHNSSLRLEKTLVGAAINPSVVIAPPLTNIKVGVIDSGIAAISRIISPLVTGRHASLPLGSHLDTSHGTLVASRVIFGDHLEDQIDDGVLYPACHVVDIPVFWNDPTGIEESYTEADLIDLLNTFIPVNPDVRIFNLSIGNYTPISDFNITPLANELDNLSKKYDVTFVVASGNMLHGQPHSWSNYPTYLGDQETRINAPAEAVLAVSVGSYAAFQEGSDIAPPNNVSPFSRVGPGMDGGVKPDLVAVGGNCYVHRSSGQFHPESSAVGLDATGNNLAYNIGTSFSAPIVSHFAAQILATDIHMSANLLKAYLIHFADLQGFPLGVSKSPGSLYGFGEFQMGEFMSNEIDRMIFVYEGSILADSYLHIPFHIPSSLTKNGDGRMKIRFTVVHDPDVDAANPGEYCISDMIFTLRKNDSGSLVDVAGTNASMSKYSVKWNPIVKYERIFSRNFSSGNWEIRLRLNTRAGTDKQYEQNFAIIIECVDERGSINFYNDFLKEHGKSYQISMRQSGTAI